MNHLLPSLPLNLLPLLPLLFLLLLQLLLLPLHPPRPPLLVRCQRPWLDRRFAQGRSLRCGMKLKCVCVCVSCQDLPAPSTIAEALQQRMDIYKSTAEGAKNKGDDRKARMYQRIVKVHTLPFKLWKIMDLFSAPTLFQSVAYRHSIGVHLISWKTKMCLPSFWPKVASVACTLTEYWNACIHVWDSYLGTVKIQKQGTPLCSVELVQVEFMEETRKGKSRQEYEVCGMFIASAEAEHYLWHWFARGSCAFVLSLVLVLFFFSLVISMWNKKNVLCFSSSKLSFNRVGMEKTLGCSRLKRGLFFRLAEGMMHALSISTFISVRHDEQERKECERNPNWHLNNIFLFTAIPGCH